MTQNELSAYWKNMSEYDMKVAQDMLNAGHYLYVGILCHQSTDYING